MQYSIGSQGGVHSLKPAYATVIYLLAEFSAASRTTGTMGATAAGSHPHCSKQQQQPTPLVRTCAGAIRPGPGSNKELEYRRMQANPSYTSPKPGG